MARTISLLLGSMTVLAVTCGFICGDQAPVRAHKALEFQMGEHNVRSPWAPAGAPVEITWKMLTDVQFKDIYVQELDAYYWKPTFGASVKALEGKDVYITGYMIPVDYDSDFYVISRYPYANCFFCGGGGPESVVDLRFAGKHRTYKTDERLTFRGRFKLNADDIYSMNYILEGAVEYQP